MKYIKPIFILCFLMIGIQTFSQTSDKGKGDVWLRFELKMKFKNFKTDSLRLYTTDYGLDSTSYHVKGQVITLKGKVLARLSQSSTPFVNEVDFPNILIESNVQTVFGKGVVTDMLTFDSYYKEIDLNITEFPLHVSHSFDITKATSKDYTPRIYTVNFEQNTVKFKDLYSVSEKLPFVAIKYEIPKK